jgi:cytochrome b
MKRQRVWDLPTRLFHWLLVAGIAAAVITGELGGNLIDWHGRAGLFVLGLVTFRLVWGFVGSSTARFASFVRGPAAIKAYLRGEWRGIGHNPLGALAVLGLLLLTAAQVGTGLFANDDIAFQGPLADLVSKEWSDQSRALHALVFNGLAGLVLLHVAAIIFYVRVKRQDLLKPMLTGWKAVPAEAVAEAPGQPAPHDREHGRGRGLVAFVVAAAVASTTVYAAAGGLLPPPAPAAVAPAAW